MPTRRQFAALLLSLAGGLPAEQRLRALIVDGRNNHDWRSTTPVLKNALEETALFTVDVATAPPGTGPVPSFRPDFDQYKVVVLNYTDLGNGGTWCAETQSAFVRYAAAGGGVVVFHAASSAFPEWREYNEIIGLGGWGGRDERCGPMIRFRDGRLVRDRKPGNAGHHGKQHPFLIVTRDPNHPVMSGLPRAWMHARDELYDSLRGPARNLDVLATAYSDPATGGTGENEPMLFTARYGQGRVFHTTLGHDPEAMSCVGFLATLQRGAEWAATGRVTQSVPNDFPTEKHVRIRR